MAFDGRTDHHYDGMKIKVHMSRYYLFAKQKKYLTNK